MLDQTASFLGIYFASDSGVSNWESGDMVIFCSVGDLNQINSFAQPSRKANILINNSWLYFC